MTSNNPQDRWSDLHNHVIPGVDDGAADPEAALAAVKAMAESGVGRIVATPHVDASVTLDPAAMDRRLGEIDQGWQRLLEAVGQGGRKWDNTALAGGSPELLRGVELKLDVPQPDLSDPRVRLGGGPAVLVEFAYFTVPPRSEHTLASIRESGYLPLLAHPERYHGTGRDLSVVPRWIAAGAFLQVNAGSIVGSYGNEVRDRAIELLERGWAHCVASDYHSRGTLHLQQARRLLGEMGEGQGPGRQVDALLVENPSRLVRGEPCRAVEPLRSDGGLRGWVRRVGRRFRK